MNLLLAKNLKYLRKANKISQQELADILGLKRTTLGDYERSTSNPSIQTLIQLAEHFDITVDQLLKDKIYNNEYTIVEDSNQKILAISVDKSNNNLIDLVESKAEAGYLSSFQDPEYIKDLPKISIPGLVGDTYRAFEINGDSMLPITSGSIIICSYVEHLDQTKDGKTYIVISKSEGLVYKRIKKDLKNTRLILQSDNEHYLPYDISLSDISELWQYHAHISFSDNKPVVEELKEQLSDMEKQIKEIKARLND